MQGQYRCDMVNAGEAFLLGQGTVLLSILKSRGRRSCDFDLSRLDMPYSGEGIQFFEVVA